MPKEISSTNNSKHFLLSIFLFFFSNLNNPFFSPSINSPSLVKPIDPFSFNLFLFTPKSPNLGKENKEGEWVVAYYGVGKGKIFEKVLNIINENLKEGHGQLYDKQVNVEKNKDEYSYCGEGDYFSPNIE